MEFKISGLKCDSQSCDYQDMSIPFADYKKYIGVPCPKCGTSILLTKSEYRQCVFLYKLVGVINFFGKIFDWSSSDTNENQVKYRYYFSKRKEKK